MVSRGRIKEVFRDVSNITDFSGNLILEFGDYKLDSQPKYSLAERGKRYNLCRSSEGEGSPH